MPNIGRRSFLPIGLIKLHDHPRIGGIRKPPPPILSDARMGSGIHCLKQRRLRVPSYASAWSACNWCPRERSGGGPRMPRGPSSRGENASAAFRLGNRAARQVPFLRITQANLPEAMVVVCVAAPDSQPLPPPTHTPPWKSKYGTLFDSALFCSKNGPTFVAKKMHFFRFSRKKNEASSVTSCALASFKGSPSATWGCVAIPALKPLNGIDTPAMANFASNKTLGLGCHRAFYQTNDVEYTFEQCDARSWPRA